MPAAISATLADSLAVDADDDGLVTPGDTLLYEAVVSNTGDLPLADVMFALDPDANTVLDPVSVVVTDGTVDTSAAR